MKKDIYVIKNDLNEKVYVGQARDSALRWVTHISDTHSNLLIDKAIRKYGKQHFHYEILEYQVENFDDREIYWIATLNSIAPNGYNISIGGKGIGYGIYSPTSKIKDKEVLDTIIEQLLTSNLSYEKLGEKFNCAWWTIYAINNGIAYKQDNITYPIRKSNRYTIEKLKQLRYSLRFELDKTIKMLADEYEMDVSSVSDINQGKLHRVDYLTYPLRSGKVTSVGINIVSEVIELLKTDMAQKDIARKFNVSVNCISQINTGKNFRVDGVTYPVRENYQQSVGRKCFSPDELLNIEKDLMESNLSIRSLAKKYETTITQIMNINIGGIKKYRKDSLIYPLRHK